MKGCSSEIVWWIHEILFLYHAGHGVRDIKLLQFSRDLLSKISQSEICVCQRTQKWIEWNLVAGVPSPLSPIPIIFSRLPRSPSPITPATQTTFGWAPVITRRFYERIIVLSELFLKRFEYFRTLLTTSEDDYID